jgi:hypothetical protein
MPALLPFVEPSPSASVQLKLLVCCLTHRVSTSAPSSSRAWFNVVMRGRGLTRVQAPTCVAQRAMASPMASTHPPQECTAIEWPRRLVAGMEHVWGLPEASSGTVEQRPGYVRLMKAAKAAEFEAILIEAQDRFWRDQGEMHSALKRLRFWGIKVFSVSCGRPPGKDSARDDGPDQARIQRRRPGLRIPQ